MGGASGRTFLVPLGRACHLEHDLLRNGALEACSEGRATRTPCSRTATRADDGLSLSSGFHVVVLFHGRRWAKLGGIAQIAETAVALGEHRAKRYGAVSGEAEDNP